MPVYLTQQFDLTAAEAFRALKMTPDETEEDTQTILSMVEKANQIARPRAVYDVLSIDRKGEDWVEFGTNRITSALVRKNLDQVNRAFPYITTCGMELEEWSKGFSDMLEQFFADTIKQLYLKKMNIYLRKQVKEQYFPASDLSVMNPGSLASWPISAQPSLFALLGDGAQKIGVSLTDSFLMLPSKSTSGLIFSAESHFENCQYCPMVSCPNRRAKFVGEM